MWQNCAHWFATTDKEILKQLIQHCTSNRLRRRALRQDWTRLSIKQIIDIGRTLEMAGTQASAMECETVHAVEPKYNNNNGKRTPAKNTNSASGHTRSTQPSPKATQLKGKLCFIVAVAIPVSANWQWKQHPWYSLTDSWLRKATTVLCLATRQQPSSNLSTSWTNWSMISTEHRFSASSIFVRATTNLSSNQVRDTLLDCTHTWGYIAINAELWNLLSEWNLPRDNSQCPFRRRGSPKHQWRYHLLWSRSQRTTLH